MGQVLPVGGGPLRRLDDDRYGHIPSRRAQTGLSLVKRLITSMLLASAATVAALSIGGTAMAAQPCWQQLINDWYDGRIDRVYPVDCYRQALIHMPEDVAQYSSMRDDISRALQAAIAAQVAAAEAQRLDRAAASTGGCSAAASRARSTAARKRGSCSRPRRTAEIRAAAPSATRSARSDRTARTPFRSR